MVPIKERTKTLSIINKFTTSENEDEQMNFF
jgi:hypothetical protein